MAIRQKRSKTLFYGDENRISDRISIKLKRHAVIRYRRQVVACDEWHLLHMLGVLGLEGPD